MILDAALPNCSLQGVLGLARAAEELGVGCLWSTETQHDPFLTGPLVFEHTQRLAFGTAVAIAFARSPATLAYTAWDLAQASGGRFRLTLMSPFFNPGPIQYPEVPIYLAGVNRGLARLAGEVAQGFCVHPLHTLDYLRRVILPELEAGAKRVGRPASEVAISANAFVAMNDEQVGFVRSQIAFYASTPSYRPVMAVHGWEEAARELSQLAAAGRWEAMPRLITDEMVHTFAVVAPADRLDQALPARYSGVAHRITPYLPFDPVRQQHLWVSLACGFGSAPT